MRTSNKMRLPQPFGPRNDNRANYMLQNSELYDLDVSLESLKLKARNQKLWNRYDSAPPQMDCLLSFTLYVFFAGSAFETTNWMGSASALTSGL